MPIKTIGIILDDIKFKHTIFAMPFAIISLFLASEGIPSAHTTFWILLTMVGARTSAMLFNRLVDAKIDKENPRTKDRALPSSKTTKTQYFILLVITTALFIFTCYKLNKLCLYLSPFALLIVFFYSYAKRFTSFSHFVLGLALSLAPIGAWVAVTETISPVSIILGIAVIFWLAGLDIIYSCQDVDFDKGYDLWSFPRKYGVKKALQLAQIFHSITVICLLSLSAINKLGIFYLTGVVIIAALLWYEHSLVSEDDLTKVNIAFFNVNGTISVLLMIVVIIDCLLI